MYHIYVTSHFQTHVFYYIYNYMYLIFNEISTHPNAVEKLYNIDLLHDLNILR